MKYLFKKLSEYTELVIGCNMRVFPPVLASNDGNGRGLWLGPLAWLPSLLRMRIAGEAGCQSWPFTLL